MSVNVAIEFPIEMLWLAIQELLSQGLGANVNVDCIGERDFDELGELTFELPAARVLFIEETAVSFETQKQNYNATQIFAVLCGDEDLSPDPQDQRTLSVRLASKVKHFLAGARIEIEDAAGDVVQSEPVEYLRTQPLPTSSGRMVYVVQFAVAGIAQFAAPNAYPSSPEEEG